MGEAGGGVGGGRGRGRYGSLKNSASLVMASNLVYHWVRRPSLMPLVRVPVKVNFDITWEEGHPRRI